jgi:acetyl-CoA carboxylase biotin carboxylase subunit
MFKKILIANRGEIAVRVHRACRELGIETVAIHSEADADALHVKMANESVCIGAASADKSYLSIPAVLAAAEVTDAEAIHPGYGFLSENAKFASIATELGFTFIGPKPEHIEKMGDKVHALALAKELGLPTIPGSDGELRDAEHASEVAARIGYPVLLKAASGGGGRGMRVVEHEKDIHEQFNQAQAEAQAAYGDNRVYLEKFLTGPRHIEVQILADSHGNVATLGERDCSYQRRHQKVLEETPSPGITAEERAHVQEISRTAVKSMGYLGAGTIEFLYQDGEFYFIEMNTRLQVEHPVTEMVTGMDLVREQIRIAAGEKLNIPEKQLQPRGHSIECRVNAEHPETFAPSPGRIQEFYTPGGPGVRVDAAVYSDYVVPPHYDSMIAKLIVHGADREEAMARLRRALEEFIVTGINTTLPLHQKIVETDAFQTGAYNIHTLTHMLKNQENGDDAESTV